MSEWPNEINPILLFLSESYPLAYYGAIVCLVIIGIYISVWGLNAIANERLSLAVRTIQPAAFVSLALSVVFIAFCSLALSRKDALANTNRSLRPASSARTQTEPPSTAAILQPDMSVNSSETAVSHSGPSPVIENQPKQPAKRDFSPAGLSALLSTFRFVLDKTSLTMGRTSETWTRSFDGKLVSLEAQSTDAGLWRIILGIPTDDGGKVGQDQEVFLREIAAAFFSDSLPIADGIIHAPTWTPARCVSVGDFYIVKTSSGETGSRLIIIHKNDPNLRDNTRQLAEQQQSTDWLEFRRWK
ncbi:MAG: hypothetical protein ABIH86_06810 [Planctomycetota bacterium]